MEALDNFVESNTHIVVSEWDPQPLHQLHLLKCWKMLYLLWFVCVSPQWGYLRRLKQLRQVLETSEFFKTHEVSTSITLGNKF